MTYPNGQIPTSALTPLSVGGHLLAYAAAAFEELRIRAERAGFDLRITSVGDAYRSLSRQTTVFLERYEVIAGTGPYGDVRYWQGRRYVRVRGASAAIPGTSNHGRGLAVDIANTGGFSGDLYRWLAANAPALGWSNAEGQKVNESWHWVHSGAFVVSNPISTGGSVSTPTLPGAPAPITPEDDMQEADFTRIEAIVTAKAREQIIQVLRAPEFQLDEGHRKALLERVLQESRLQHPVFGDGGQPLPAVLADVFVHARAAANAEALVTAIVAALTPAIGEVQEDVVRDAVNGAIAGLTIAHTSTSTLIPAADET